MDFEDVKDRVYPLLQDKLEKTWLNPVVAKAVTKALRKVGNKVGRDEARITLSLVQSQQEYPLPAGVRRIKSVKIIPENGNEPPRQGIPQVALDCIPITTQDETDPRMFSLSLTGGNDANQYALFFWPVPARNGTNDIVITYDVDTVILSDDPSTSPQNAVILPYPEQFEEAIVYYTAMYLLFERADDKDVEQGVKFQRIADQELRENRPVDAMSFYQNNHRAMP